MWLHYGMRGDRGLPEQLAEDAVLVLRLALPAVLPGNEGIDDGIRQCRARRGSDLDRRDEDETETIEPGSPSHRDWTVSYPARNVNGVHGSSDDIRRSVSRS